jgi:hypothetical protein
VSVRSEVAREGEETNNRDVVVAVASRASLTVVSSRASGDVAVLQGERRQRRSEREEKHETSTYPGKVTSRTAS